MYQFSALRCLPSLLRYHGINAQSNAPNNKSLAVKALDNCEMIVFQKKLKIKGSYKPGHFLDICN